MFHQSRSRHSFLGWIGILIGISAGIFAFVLLLLVGTGLSLGAANAWVFQRPFSQGWHAVWQRWPVAVAWWILFGFKGVVKSSRR